MGTLAALATAFILYRLGAVRLTGRPAIAPEVTGEQRVRRPPLLAVRPVFLHKQERILSLVGCAMIALLVFALLGWAARHAGEDASGTVLLAGFADLHLPILCFHHGSRRVTGLDPPAADLLRTLGWAPATRYNVMHP
jgi:hypothetical protein